MGQDNTLHQSEEGELHESQAVTYYTHLPMQALAIASSAYICTYLYIH